VKEAEARQRQSELIYEDLKKTINIEVENAYLDLITQREILKSLEDQLTFARDNYNATSKQFEFGLANSIDVMDANTLLVTAERQLAEARLNYQLADLRLKRATGTLLKTVVSGQ
jgi:outer membrane protein